MRPLRPDPEHRKSRPLSGQLKLNKTLVSIDTGTSPPSGNTTPTALVPPSGSLATNGGDEPPPLPQKQQHSDYANLMDLPTAAGAGKSRATSAMPRLNSKEKVRLAYAEMEY